MKTVHDAIEWAKKWEAPKIYALSKHAKNTQNALQILAETVQEMREFLEEVKKDSIPLGYPDYAHIPSVLADRANKILKR